MHIVHSSRRLLLSCRQPQSVANTDSLEDEHAIVFLDLILCLRGQPIGCRRNLARFQRATKGSGQSTCGRGNDVVQRRCVLLTRAAAIMLSNGAVHAEAHRALVRR